MTNKTAKYLAVILGPHIWLPILFFILILKSGLNDQQLIIIAPSLLIFQVITPIAYLIFAPKLGWVSGWDMKNKRERRPFFIIMLILTLTTLIIIYFYANNLLFNLYLIFVSLLIILFAITIFWKISLHASLNTASAILINFLFNWKLPYLYLTIPIIYWTRLKLNKHTHSQLIAGILVTSIILFLGFRLFNYI